MPMETPSLWAPKQKLSTPFIGKNSRTKRRKTMIVLIILEKTLFSWTFIIFKNHGFPVFPGFSFFLCVCFSFQEPSHRLPGYGSLDGHSQARALASLRGRQGGRAPKKTESLFLFYWREGDVWYDFLCVFCLLMFVGIFLCVYVLRSFSLVGEFSWVAWLW